MKTDNKRKSINATLQFIDYLSFDELASDHEILVSLISGYRNIFGEPDIWDEQYSAKELHAKLAHDLDGQAVLRLCIDNDKQSVVGFCWAQLLKANDIISTMQSVHYYKAYDSPEIEKSLNNIIGENSVIYVHDLGVCESYRGVVSLEQLICPVIENITNMASTRNIFFWSIEETSVAWLARKIGIKVSLSVGNLQFFKGRYPMSKLEFREQ